MPCPGCPFLLTDKVPPGTLSVADVDAWLDPEDRWTCHALNHSAPCQGAAMFRDGQLPGVTREALIAFWVVGHLR